MPALMVVAPPRVTDPLSALFPEVNNNDAPFKAIGLATVIPPEIDRVAPEATVAVEA